MHRKPLVRSVALVVALVIGGLTSGVPSHYHGAVGPVPVFQDADHHGHVVQLVDQSDRLKSDVPSLGASHAARLIEFDLSPIEVVERFVSSSHLKVGGRAPPTARPRAPPVSD